MTNNSEDNYSTNMNSSQQTKTLGVNRRQMIVGGAGIAGLAATSADSGMEKPVCYNVVG
ncbi:MAG: hypothetical protein PUP92_26405 [Rhizonema sp. PD38]|nr:hypothetical protein [Rhizonema sp. PD38]